MTTSPLGCGKTATNVLLGLNLSQYEESPISFEFLSLVKVESPNSCWSLTMALIAGVEGVEEIHVHLPTSQLVLLS